MSQAFLPGEIGQYSMPAFTYRSPLAEGGAAITQFLERRRAEQREQLMLELRRDEAESRMALEADQLLTSAQQRELAGPAATSRLETEAAARAASEASTAGSETNRLAQLAGLAQGQPGEVVPEGMDPETLAFMRENNLINTVDESDIVGGSGATGDFFRGTPERREKDTILENLKGAIKAGGSGRDYALNIGLAGENLDPLAAALMQQEVQQPGMVYENNEFIPAIDAEGRPVDASRIKFPPRELIGRGQSTLEFIGQTPEGLPVIYNEQSGLRMVDDPSTGKRSLYFGPIEAKDSPNQSSKSPFTIPAGFAEKEAESDDLRDAGIGQMNLPAPVERIVLDDVVNADLLGVPEKQLAIWHVGLNHMKPEEIEGYMLAMRRYRMTPPGPHWTERTIDWGKDLFGVSTEEEPVAIQPDLATALESLQGR